MLPVAQHDAVIAKRKASLGVGLERAAEALEKTWFPDIVVVERAEELSARLA